MSTEIGVLLSASEIEAFEASYKPLERKIENHVQGIVDVEFEHKVLDVSFFRGWDESISGYASFKVEPNQVLWRYENKTWTECGYLPLD